MNGLGVIEMWVAFPTRRRTPLMVCRCCLDSAVDHHGHAPRSWRSRLALDVGEGQKQTRCIDSHVRSRDGGVCKMLCFVASIWWFYKCGIMINHIMKHNTG
jgi:hypothetical protein